MNQSLAASERSARITSGVVDSPEIVADFGDLNGEAPVWDPDSQSLYWTDCVGYKFFRFDLRAKRCDIVRSGIEVTGYALHKDGGFVIANSKGIWLWDGADRLQLIASEIDGALCQMNDAAADPAGRFLAGSCFYKPACDYELGCLFRVDTDARCVILDDGIHLANGIGFSPAGTELYFTDSAARIIYRYDYDVRSGEARNRSILIRVPVDEGIPDGLAVDAQGFLWSAQWYGGCLVRYDPDGVVERKINIPAKQSSSVAFGGPEFCDIFVTSAAEAFQSPLEPAGYNATSSRVGGPLFHLNLGIAGKPQFKANLALAR